MDISGDCGTATGTVGVVVMMLTDVARVAALIRIKLFNCVFGGGICSICSGISCVPSGSGSDGNSYYGGPSLSLHYNYKYNKHTHNHNHTT